jgi:hypothetical protein
VAGILVCRQQKPVLWAARCVRWQACDEPARRGRALGIKSMVNELICCVWRLAALWVNAFILCVFRCFYGYKTINRMVKGFYVVNRSNAFILLRLKRCFVLACGLVVNSWLIG